MPKLLARFKVNTTDVLSVFKAVSVCRLLHAVGAVASYARHARRPT